MYLGRSSQIPLQSLWFFVGDVFGRRNQWWGVAMRRWLAWNLFFRLQEQAKGHSTLEILRQMEKVDRLSTQALDQLCRERLQELLGYCYLHVPYVRGQM